MVEQGTHKPLVASSNLALGTTKPADCGFFDSSKIARPLVASLLLRGISQAQQISPSALQIVISDRYSARTCQRRWVSCLIVLDFGAPCGTASTRKSLYIDCLMQRSAAMPRCAEPLRPMLLPCDKHNDLMLCSGLHLPVFALNGLNHKTSLFEHLT